MIQWRANVTLPTISSQGAGSAVPAAPRSTPYGGYAAAGRREGSTLRACDLRAVLALLLMVPIGCAHTVRAPVSTPIPETKPIDITGYSTVLGGDLRFEGRVYVGSDSLKFWRRVAPHQRGSLSPRDAFMLSHALPVEDVVSLHVRRVHLVRTLLLVPTPALAWAVIFALGGFQGSSE